LRLLPYSFTVPLLVRIASNAAADMLKVATEFGMTPASRVRLAGAGPWLSRDGGEFGDLI
jgi:phage terminase small subunit